LIPGCIAVNTKTINDNVFKKDVFNPSTMILQRYVSRNSKQGFDISPKSTSTTAAFRINKRLELFVFVDFEEKGRRVEI